MKSDVLGIEVLTQDEMKEIDRRQTLQQAEWKAIPEEGQVTKFLGTELVVLPGVFPPKADSLLLAEHLRLDGVRKVLDMGTGTGALAIWAAEQGAASVVAVDIAKAAVRNAKRNVERLGLGNRIDVRLGSGFDSISKSESFDVILANLPGRNKRADDETSAAQWDTEFRAHRSLLVGAKTHLRSNGRIYMVKANYPDLLELVSLAEAGGYDVAVLAKSTPIDGDPRRYYVLSLSLVSEIDV